MNINIRKSIMSNFKDTNKNDIFESIENAINDQEEVTLPGLGVFFELLWLNSSKKKKEEIIDIISSSL
ncbi:MAG: small acid-soluble spore protein SspI [Bacilli bacterium]|nr:small acid-soluble spore protein SspI [Bacilli bacterium]